MKFLLWLFLLGFTQPILASGEHDAWAGAKSAYARQDSVLLTRYASALRNYPLYPYIQYWQLRLDWDSLTNAQVMNYVDSNQISVLSQKLLGDWLKKLGHDQDYKTFRRDYVQLLNPDTEIVCDDLDAHLTESKDDVLEHGVRLWLSPYSRPSSCLPVFNALFSEKGNYPLVWERLRLALDNGQVALAQFIIDHFLNNADKRRMAGLRSVLRDPIAFLENRRVKVGTKPDRILLRFALFQAYDKHPKRTLKVWKKLQYRLNRADRQGIWAGIALRAARNHDKTAVRYFDQAGRHLTQEELAWQARSALLEGDWQLVRYSIHEMPPGMEAHSEWRYWLARSDLKLGETVKAREKLVGIAHGLGYFSLLAREDLGKKLSWPHGSYIPSAEEIKQVGQLPGIRLVVYLMKDNMSPEANAQWFYSIRNLGDRLLIAAAAFANEHHWYDLAINTELRSRSVHNYGLEFPIPYRSTISAFSDNHHLDEAFVLGLMRQESRFYPEAISHSGAIGLMQLMPDTIRWIDGKAIGLTPGNDNNISRNIGQGTWYLEYVLHRCNNLLALAAAAYNAGPTRVMSWLPSSKMDGEIWVETIPYRETRVYVEKVLANTTYYTMHLQSTHASLKAWLPSVSSKTGDLNAPDGK